MIPDRLDHCARLFFGTVNCDCSSVMQCWRGTDRRVHSSEYCAGEDEVRGCRRHVPDSQVVASSAAVDGSERGAIATFSFHC